MLSRILVFFLLATGVSHAQTPVELRTLADFEVAPEVEQVLKMYGDGHGDPADFPRCYETLSQAAAMDDPVAQYYAAQMLRFGQGCDYDAAAAGKLYQSAADLNVAEAYTALGDFALQGIGREASKPDAAKFYLVASELDPNAMIAYALLLQRDSKLGNRSTAISLRQRAVDLGNAQAMADLGSSYLRRNQPEYQQKGLALLEQAIELGEPTAYKHMAQAIYKESAGLTKDNKRAGELNKKARFLTYKKIQVLLDEAIFDYRRYGVESGVKELTEKQQIWLAETNDRTNFYNSTWGEAQVRSGREDPYWGYRIYKVLDDETLARTGKGSIGFIQGNMINDLHTVGHIAEARERMLLWRESLREQKGIDLRIPQPEVLAYGEPILPRIEDMPFQLRHVEFEGMDKRAKSSIGKVLWWVWGHPIENSIYVERNAGNWREALAYSHWATQWADLALTEERGPTWRVEGVKYDALLARAKLYKSLGFYREATEIFKQIIDAEYNSYNDRLRRSATFNLVEAEIGLGQQPSYDLQTLNAMRATNADNQYEAATSAFYADITIARALWDAGRKQEAYELFSPAIKFAVERKLPGLELSARHLRLSHRLSDGQTDGVMEDLLICLDICRTKAYKKTEGCLYRHYAELMELEGNLPAAIELQEKSISIYQSLDLYTWLPLRYAELANLYHQADATERADYYAAMAQKLLDAPGAVYPENIRQDVREELAPPADQPPTAAVASATESQPADAAKPDFYPNAFHPVDLQPVDQVCVPLPDQAGLGIYTLSNLSLNPQNVRLELTGPVQRISYDPENGAVYVVLADIPSATQYVHPELAASEQQFIEVTSPANLENAALAMRLKSMDDTLIKEAAYRTPGSSASPVAIINAAAIEHNPYYLVSIFHQIQRKADADALVNLRFVASRPSRIECYDGRGSLMFIDADGDGAFTSAGDAMRHDADRDNDPDVLFATDVLQETLELRVLPLDETDRSEVSIDIFRRQQDEWRHDATDMIRFKP